MERTLAKGLPVLRFPHLARSERVYHAILTRRGGVSHSPFDTLNLGASVGDAVSAVEENHRRALGALGLGVWQFASGYLVHGNRVGVVGRSDVGTVRLATDALVTAEPGVPLLLRFADCVPVLFYEGQRQAVGLAHAGWRGLVAGVLSATVAAMVDQLGCQPEKLWAGIGPAIGGCCYEVGQDTADEVASACPPGACISQRRDGRVYLDLHAAARAQLEQAGVGTVEDSGLCTACQVTDFFSHRAEHGRTGRFGIVIGLSE